MIWEYPYFWKYPYQYLFLVLTKANVIISHAQHPAILLSPQLSHEIWRFRYGTLYIQKVVVFLDFSVMFILKGSAQRI